MALGAGHSSPLRGHMLRMRSLIHSAGPPRRSGVVSAGQGDPPHGENIPPARTFLQAMRPTPDTRRASWAVGAYLSYSSPSPPKRAMPCSSRFRRIRREENTHFLLMPFHPCSSLKSPTCADSIRKHDILCLRSRLVPVAFRSTS